MKTLTLTAAAALILAPFAALAALPVVGDVLGTDADTVKAALEAAGCPVEKFEAEDGSVEAVCKDAETGKMLEIVIDPKTGAVTDVKEGD